MPWQHCGLTISDDQKCPECGFFKESRTVAFDKTRVFALGGDEWDGDGEAQAEALKSAHDGATPFCEECEKAKRAQQQQT